MTTEDKIDVEYEDLQLESEGDSEEGVELYFGDRYIKAPVCVELPEEYMMYSKAEDLAKKIRIGDKTRYYVIAGGGFIFGDFIEAFIITNNAKCRRVMISTLSLSQNNIDSLANLLNTEYIDQLDMVVSDHFYSHERSGLIPYMYKELDKNNKFQLATAGSHTKICLIETLGGKHIVIHGSANLRSSSNIEQFVIEENKGLFDFWYDYHNRILGKYKTIKKSIRGGELWQVVAATAEAEVKDRPQKREQDSSKSTLDRQKPHSNLVRTKK